MKKTETGLKIPAPDGNGILLGSSDSYRNSQADTVDSGKRPKKCFLLFRQRIREARMYYNTNTDNSWTGITATDDYASSYAYDKNGNLTDLSRNGTFALGLDMDRFSYKYELKAPTCPSCQPTPWNRLDRVIDLGSNYGAYEDIKSGQSLANYDYDALGQLLSDEQEGIKLEWRFGDKKVKSIKPITPAGSDKPDILFEYNPFGQRILKIEKPRSGGTLSNQNDWKYTYYSYDANGQVMAVYELNRPSSNAGKATLKEQHLYGASRLGMRQQTLVIYDNGLQTPTDNGVKTQQLGEKRYEISNYLGNVNAVITDRKTANIGSTGALYEAVVVMTADYYPFGMTMPGRNTSPGDYRYAYNGMEVDNEVKGNGNSYTTTHRQYDPRLGRWMSLDPLKAAYPSMTPYSFAGNSPVACSDNGGQFIIFVNGYVYGKERGTHDDISAGRGYWYKTGEHHKRSNANGTVDDSEFIAAAKEYFGDTRVKFVNGSGSGLGSDDQTRRKAGRDYAEIMVEQYRAILKDSDPDEKIEILTHSMGGAFAEGMIEYFQENATDVASRITKVVHLSTADADDVMAAANTDRIERIQLNTQEDNTLDWADFWTRPKNRRMNGVDLFGLMEWSTDRYHYDWKRRQEEKGKSTFWDSHYDTKSDPRTFDWIRDLEEVGKKISKITLEYKGMNLGLISPSHGTRFVTIEMKGREWECSDTTLGNEQSVESDKK